MESLEQVLRLAGLEPQPSGDDPCALVEARVGPLPRSFAALLRSNVWHEALSFGSCDHPHGIDTLGLPMTGYGVPYLGASDGVLPFLSETQGVCTWAIRLGDAEDSEVLVEVDSMPRPKWQPTCSSFLTWLRCRIEDGHFLARAMFAAQAPALDPSTRDRMRAVFEEGTPTFAWPGHTNYRFRGALVDVLLWDTDDQCDWFIAPRGDAREALRAIPNIRHILSALYGLSDDAQATLERIRSLDGTDDAD